jgi:hypothetical protein
MKPFSRLYSGFGRLGEEPRWKQAFFFTVVAIIIWIEDTWKQK